MTFFKLPIISKTRLFAVFPLKREHSIYARLYRLFTIKLHLKRQRHYTKFSVDYLNAHCTCLPDFVITISVPIL